MKATMVVGGTLKFLALLPLVAGLAAANSIMAVNGPCATNNSLTCAADISFDFSVAGQLTLTVQNDFANPQSANELLSAVQFTLSGGSAGSLVSGTGTQRTVASNGTFTDGGTIAAGWVFSEAGTTFTLNDLVGTGHAGPAQTIIGSPDSGGIYSNANNSITGNGAHNPFLANSATFVLSISGINANTTVQSASFQFGTENGNFQAGNSQTPEPVTFVLMGTGLVGLGLLRRKIRA